MTKISEVIKQLRKLKRENGDLDVVNMGFNGGMNSYPIESLEVGYLKILKGKEYITRLWHKWDGEEVKGKKIVNI